MNEEKELVYVEEEKLEIEVQATQNVDMNNFVLPKKTLVMILLLWKELQIILVLMSIVLKCKLI